MKRLVPLMMGFSLLASSAELASASSYVSLGSQANNSFATIGKAPPKRVIKLSLGALRTKDVTLPGGERSLKDRVRLRNKRALKRQQAVETATRKPENEDRPEADFSSDDPDGVLSRGN